MDFKSIFTFLADIKDNNNKEWMDANRPVYQKAREEFIKITQYIIDSVGQYDENILGVDPKKAIFRINRDIRFSKNKDPYKTNFGAFMVPDGKKSGNAGYYLHLQPGEETFIAGGVYMPASDRLVKIRQEIDYNASELKKISDHPDFQKYFGEIQGEKLKRAPKGYPMDHPNLELLKLKSFLVAHKVSDKQVLSEGFSDYAVEVFRAMTPFNEYLNVAMSEQV